MSRVYDGLQVVEKTFSGVVIGYVVGWWVAKRRFRWSYDERDDDKDSMEDGSTFRSIREGVVFSSKAKALRYRDKLEAMRNEKTEGVKFTAVE